MILGALYLASLSAFLARYGHSPDDERDVAVTIAFVCVAMLVVAAALLVLARVSA